MAKRTPFNCLLKVLNLLKTLLKSCCTHVHIYILTITNKKLQKTAQKTTKRTPFNYLKKVLNLLKTPPLFTTATIINSDDYCFCHDNNTRSIFEHNFLFEI